MATTYSDYDQIGVDDLHTELDIKDDPDMSTTLECTDKYVTDETAYTLFSSINSQHSVDGVISKTNTKEDFLIDGSVEPITLDYSGKNISSTSNLSPVNDQNGVENPTSKIDRGKSKKGVPVHLTIGSLPEHCKTKKVSTYSKNTIINPVLKLVEGVIEKSDLLNTTTGKIKYKNLIILPRQVSNTNLNANNCQNESDNPTVEVSNNVKQKPILLECMQPKSKTATPAAQYSEISKVNFLSNNGEKQDSNLIIQEKDTPLEHSELSLLHPESEVSKMQSENDLNNVDSSEIDMFEYIPVQPPRKTYSKPVTRPLKTASVSENINNKQPLNSENDLNIVDSSEIDKFEYIPVQPQRKTHVKTRPTSLNNKQSLNNAMKRKHVSLEYNETNSRNVVVLPELSKTPSKICLSSNDDDLQELTKQKSRKTNSSSVLPQISNSYTIQIDNKTSEFQFVTTDEVSQSHTKNSTTSSETPRSNLNLFNDQSLNLISKNNSVNRTTVPTCSKIINCNSLSLPKFRKCNLPSKQDECLTVNNRTANSKSSTVNPYKILTVDINSILSANLDPVLETDQLNSSCQSQMNKKSKSQLEKEIAEKQLIELDLEEIQLKISAKLKSAESKSVELTSAAESIKPSHQETETLAVNQLIVPGDPKKQLVHAEKQLGKSKPTHSRCISCGDLYIIGQFEKHKEDVHIYYPENFHIVLKQKEVRTEIDPTQKNKKLCFICGRFIKNSFIETHVFNHREKTFRCDMCPLLFRTQENLDRHKLVHSTEGKYPCLKCPKKFHSSCSIRHHILKVHTKEWSYHCTMCSEIVKSESEIKQHVIKNHNSKKLKVNKLYIKKSPYSCSICDKYYSCQFSFRIHMKRIHSHRRYLEDSKKKCICDFCGIRYQFKSTMKCHMAKHLGVREYICKRCGKSFDTVCARKRHRQKCVHKI